MKYIIATARSPFSHDRIEGKDVIRQNIGGVATGLKRLMQTSGGIWVCWGDGTLDHEHSFEDYDGYKIARITLGKNEKRGFYDDYSNGTLWPLFHYFRDKIKTDNRSYHDYYSVNKKFAETILKYYEPSNIIWVHDYQLSLVPGMIKKARPEAFVTTTWHIPWVAGEFFAILPESAEIQESLSSSDLISFHTDLYTRNFIETQEQIFGSASNIKSRVVAIPLGIDDQYYSSVGKDEKPRKQKDNRKIIFSVDRLDYTKGLKNRILAIDLLLHKHPELEGKFSYIMMVTPSRTTVGDYVAMKRDLEMNIGRVNGKYGNIDWMPIVYMYRKVSDAALKANYRNADVALITPLMDGLNLVSKEFVAASRDGVLVLSRFAGASYDLQSALLVNPYNIVEMADNIYAALFMDPEERKRRLADLKATVSKKNVAWWLGRIEKEITKRWVGDTFSTSGLVDN